MKNVLIKIVNAIAILTIVCAVIVLLSVILTPKGQVPSFFGYSSFRVVSGSMEPEISTGSMILSKRVEPSAVKVGDVISFISADPELNGAVNTHRVVSIQESGGHYSFETKGDANPVADKDLVREENLLGVMAVHSELLGALIGLLAKPMVFLPVIILPLLIILIFNLVSTVKMAKHIAKEEEEAAIQETLERLQKVKENAEKTAPEADDSAEKPTE